MRFLAATTAWAILSLVVVFNQTSVPEWCDSTAYTVAQDCGQTQ